jgi:hypothetical protein
MFISIIWWKSSECWTEDWGCPIWCSC